MTLCWILLVNSLRPFKIPGLKVLSLLSWPILSSLLSWPILSSLFGPVWPSTDEAR